MTNFGPITVNQPIEVQAICTDASGNNVFSPTFFVYPSCSGCLVTDTPNSMVGVAGTPVPADLTGSATGPIQWYTSSSDTGPWIPAPLPTTIQAGTGITWWRFCCVEDPTVCSTAAYILETAGQATIAGTAVTTEGGFVQGATAQLLDSNGSTPGTNVLDIVPTDTNGQFEFNVSPGCYWIRMYAPIQQLWTNGLDVIDYGEYCVGNGDNQTVPTSVLDTGGVISLRNPWELTTSDYSEYETLTMAEINALPGQDPTYCALGLEDVAYDTTVTDNGPSPTQGQFRFFAAPSHYLPDDPIVFPNQPGASHLHMFYGNTLADASSTGQSLLDSGGATVQGGAGANRSAYWIPALFDGPKGGAANPRNIIIPSVILVYYKSYQPLSLDPAMIPNGLEIIGGNLSDGTTGMVHYTSMAGYMEKAQWGFYDPNTGLLVNSQTTIPTSNPGGYQYVRAAIQFPQCIATSGGLPVLASGNHLDHQHLLEAGGFGNQNAPCPTTHPYRIPQISILVDWRWPADGDTSQWRLSSDSLADTALVAPTPGGSVHGDILFAWNECVEQAWYDGCMDPTLSFSGARNCTAGQTGTNGAFRNLDRLQNTLTISNMEYIGPDTVPDPWDV